MDYPSLAEVENAEHEQLCRWSRFLPSPGINSLDKGDEIFETALKSEAETMGKIMERLKALGGFTPEISRKIGWNQPQ